MPGHGVGLLADARDQRSAALEGVGPMRRLPAGQPDELDFELRPCGPVAVIGVSLLAGLWRTSTKGVVRRVVDALRALIAGRIDDHGVAGVGNGLQGGIGPDAHNGGIEWVATCHPRVRRPTSPRR